MPFFEPFILCEFHIMHSAPTHLPVPSYPPSILPTSPSKENERERERENLVVEVSVCLSVYPLSKHLCLQMFISVSCWSGSRLWVLPHLSILDPYLASSWLSCCCPMSWRSFSFGSVGLVPSCTSADHRRVDVRVGQLKALDSSLGNS